MPALIHFITMKKSREYEEKTKTLISPILDEYGFELTDIEFVKEGDMRYLRVYIDKPEGITINDCVAVSERMNPILDAEDYIEEQYTFEVSSPDLSRPIKKNSQLSRAVGKEVEISLYKPLNGQKQLVGTLKSFDENDAVITLSGDEDITLKRSDIAQMRYYISFN